MNKIRKFIVAALGSLVTAGLVWYGMDPQDPQVAQIATTVSGILTSILVYMIPNKEV